jgi:NAD+ diphosphatase
MPSFSSQMTFAGNPLDRDHVKRLDKAWLDAAAKSEKAKILAFSEGKALLAGQGANPDYKLAWLFGDEVGPQGDAPIFLGMAGDVPHFAVELTQPPAHLADIGTFAEPRGALASLPAGDAAIVGEGRAMLLWHRRHRFCSNCGKPTDSVDGGWKRHCPSCEAEHFPRTDPVVIMLAVSGDAALLGRQSSFPPQWYTALAGFMEPGETIEEAVAREIHEESNIRVGAVHYVGCQPWPYPSSLMIGCIAEAVTSEITVDGVELEEARWFTRAEVRAALAGEGPLLIPPPFAIAHHLMRHWVGKV